MQTQGKLFKVDGGLEVNLEINTMSNLKGIFMSKKSMALFAAFLLVGCSGGESGAPGEDDVKQAAYEHYKAGSNASFAEGLKKQLAVMKVVGCKKEAHGYRCELSHPEKAEIAKEFLVKNKETGKWQIERLDSYKN